MANVAYMCLFNSNTQKIEACIDLYQIDDEGEEVNYFSYMLENVRGISISPMISALTAAMDMEAVSFSFENITLAFHEGNLTACDSWLVR